MQVCLDGQQHAPLQLFDPVAQYAIPEAVGLWEVRPSPGKGRGVFATCAIQKGTQLLAESPLFSVSPPPFVPGKGYSVSAMTLDVKAAFESLSREHQAQYLSCHEERLPSDTDDDRLFRILRSNAYTTKDHRIGIYPRIALINHACQPNVLNVDTDTGRHIIAARDIAAGEELFTTYIPLLADTVDRRARLAQYGFQCDCDACTSRGSDAERVRMGRMLQELESAVSAAVDGGQRQRLSAMAAELAKYVEEEGLSDYYVKTSRLAVEFASRAGEKSVAVYWARKHLENHRFVNISSQDSGDAEKLLAHVTKA